MCCGGITCLNNGTACSKDCECGAGICNIANKCGIFDGVCPDGLLNCKNQSCLKPSTKGEGEEYDCEGECIYGSRGDGVCNGSPTWELIKRGIVILGVLIVVCFIFKKYLLDAASELKKIREKIKQLSLEVEKLNSESKKLSEDIASAKIGKETLEGEINEGKQEIKQIKKKIKNAKGRAKKRFENELKELENLQSERVGVIATKEKEISDKRRKLEGANAELDKRYDDLVNKYWRELEAEYGRGKIEKNDSGYPVFSDSKKPIHISKFEAKFGKIGPDNQIHHIDKNKMNSNYWNLIKISKEQHRRLVHIQLIHGDWNKGLKALMGALGWTEKDLPQHILDHLKKHPFNSDGQ